METAKVIAEVGANHQGDMDTAKRMIEIAADCGVWAVKFAKRDPATFTVMTGPHPDPRNSFGATYGEHRSRLEFSIEQHAELKRCCEDNGVVYSSSASDLKSAIDIASLEPEYVKIPSSMNQHWEWYDVIKGIAFATKIHVSTGMSTYEDFHNIDRNWPDDVTLYLCTSAYPIRDNEARLSLLWRMPVQGWSSHAEGIVLEPVAAALGVQYIEKHFTLDRNQKGTDHAMSIEPDELRQMVVNIKRVTEAMSVKTFDLMECEIPAMKKLRQTA